MQRNNLLKFWPLLIIFFISAFAFCSLLKGGFFPIHDSLQVLRLHQMEKCFLDGQLPCRWAPDLGGGFGLPLFNYYSPLVYYLGIVFRLLGFSFIVSIKALFFLGILLSGFSMYLLGREFWGDLGGLVSAALYVFVPYHALDIYVRGDLAEFFALSILPLVFWVFYRLFKEKNRAFWFLAVFSLAAFLLSHNITVMLTLPLFLVWFLFWLFVPKRVEKKIFLRILLAGLIGFGLTAFYLLPAWFERNLVQLEGLTTGYFDFRAHFASLKQLFLDRSWGYGISLFGDPDTISLQIGWPHWWLVIGAGLVGLLRRKKRQDKQVFLISLFLFLFLVLSFMAHPRSIFIWERIPLLAFVQFPWRFLGPLGFVTSFLAGSIFLLFSGKKKTGAIFLAAFIIGLTLALNFSYFKPERFLPLSDQDFLSGEAFKRERMGSIRDFLPREVVLLPGLDLQSPQAVEGEVSISGFLRKSDYFKINIEVFGEKAAEILIPVFNFPNWETFIDEQPVLIEKNQWGLILVESPPGKHEISGWLKNTKMRLFGNAISLISLLSLVFCLAYNDKKTEKS
jgi:hypothetical protein